MKKAFGFGILVFALIVVCMIDQARINQDMKEAKEKQEEAQAAEQLRMGIENCYTLFRDLYSNYLPGDVQFYWPCYDEPDLWGTTRYLPEGGVAIEDFLGIYSEGNLMKAYIEGYYTITGSAIPIGDGVYLVVGDLDIKYKPGFMPSPTDEQSDACHTIEVPNARYNSPGCIAYRALGGSSGLGGENPSNPNYDPECAYPTRQQTVCP